MQTRRQFIKKTAMGASAAAIVAPVIAASPEYSTEEILNVKPAKLEDFIAPGKLPVDFKRDEVFELWRKVIGEGIDPALCFIHEEHILDQIHKACAITDECPASWEIRMTQLDLWETCALPEEADDPETTGTLRRMLVVQDEYRNMPHATTDNPIEASFLLKSPVFVETPPEYDSKYVMRVRISNLNNPMTHTHITKLCRITDGGGAYRQIALSTILKYGNNIPDWAIF